MSRGLRRELERRYLCGRRGKITQGDLQFVALFVNEMTPFTDDRGLEVGKLLDEVIVEGFRLVEFVEGFEMLALGFKVLGGLDEEETPVPEVRWFEAFLRRGGGEYAQGEEGGRDQC